MLFAARLPQVRAEACISLQASWEQVNSSNCPNHVWRTKSSIKKWIIVCQTVRSMFGEQTFTQLRTGFSPASFLTSFQSDHPVVLCQLLECSMIWVRSALRLTCTWPCDLWPIDPSTCIYHSVCHFCAQGKVCPCVTCWFKLLIPKWRVKQKVRNSNDVPVMSSLRVIVDWVCAKWTVWEFFETRCAK